MLIDRLLTVPKDSFFLFGPRGTGKSTWLKTAFKADVNIDLLRSENYFEYSQNPSLLRSRLLAKKSKKLTVVIDEIQKVPELLNEVHALIEDFPGVFHFALTGSSARKLRRSEANLLAGRSLTRYFFPLVFKEIGSRFNIEKTLKFGTLPKIFSLEDDSDKVDYLRAYTQTYLKEEIQQEALVRNLPSYVRFLKHLALSNGQVLNLSNISREAGISRAPLENYMSILADTLLGTLLEPIHLKAKVKEVSTPKFYFFDCGVVEALSGNIGESLEGRVGSLFETLVFNELRAYSEFSKKHFEIYYWGTPSSNEVDFVLIKGKKAIGVEVKYSRKWKSEFSNGLDVLLAAKKIQKAYVVYRGDHEEIHGEIHAIPFKDFCNLLYGGEIM